jgi:hypothetical protein
LNSSEWKIKLALSALSVGPTVFLKNLCSEDHGNPTNGLFGIAPPSVEEYLFLVNNNLLIRDCARDQPGLGPGSTAGREDWNYIHT